MSEASVRAEPLFQNLKEPDLDRVMNLEDLQA